MKKRTTKRKITASDSEDEKWLKRKADEGWRDVAVGEFRRMDSQQFIEEMKD